MKKLILYSCTLYLLAIAQSSFGQAQETPKFESKITNFYQDNQGYNIIELKKDVHFKTSKVNIKNAQKITYYQETGEVVVEGCKTFTTQGKVVVAAKPHAATRRILSFYLNDDTIYIE